MSVAVIAPSWLGDLVMARGAVGALKSALGEERLDLFCLEPLADVARAILPADEVVPFAGRGGFLARAAGKIALASELRSRGPRTAVLLPNSFGSALAAWPAGASERVGTAMHGRSFLLTRRVDALRPGEHQADAYTRVAEAALDGARAPAGTPAAASVPDGVREAAAGLLRGQGLDPAREAFLVLAPGAAYGPAKRWGGASFAEVARAAAERGLRPVMAGAPAESSLASEVARLAPGSAALDLTGKTTLAELAGVLSFSAGFCGNDSGVAHLAAAVGAPTVAVFLSTDSARTSPRGPRVRTLVAPVACRPCFRRTCRDSSYRCREAVAPGEAVRALDGLGAFGAGRARPEGTGGPPR
jgi:heptosyltransferase-2